MSDRFDPENPMQVGGQAVIEGVMMRAPGMIATAVRSPDGSIILRKDPYVGLAERNRFFRLPVIRGAVGLVEMLVIGMRMLNYSAEVALQHEAGNGNGEASVKKSAGMGLRGALTLAIALSAGVAVFFATPLLVTSAFFKVDQDPVAFNLIAGAIRLILLLAYLVMISLMKDVRRLFEYHGAEHKAVFTFESGEDLELSAAMSHARFHPRCGTSFLLLVMVVAILLFAALDALVIASFGSLTLTIRLATHLPLIPLVGGVSYELIRISARRSAGPIGRVIVAPGLWLQRITTREPDGGELEVALAALRCALGRECAAAVTSVTVAEGAVR